MGDSNEESSSILPKHSSVAIGPEDMKLQFAASTVSGVKSGVSALSSTHEALADMAAGQDRSVPEAFGVSHFADNHKAVVWPTHAR